MTEIVRHIMIVLACSARLPDFLSRHSLVESSNRDEFIYSFFAASSASKPVDINYGINMILWQSNQQTSSFIGGGWRQSEVIDASTMIN